MRVTAETKTATRQAILQAARRLFAENGFEATTTRDIAQAAAIASGTLFNYFATKEAIVASMADEALGKTWEGFARGTSGYETFEESLFAVIAASLRKLKPLRKYLPALLTTSLSPLAEGADQNAAGVRVAHLEAVTAVAARHGYRDLSPLALQLYWTLYVGVLVFWAGDGSPKQEDTLALVDESISMFVEWLASSKSSKRTSI
jgi:AcrR family transcriptional regulator